jgi:inhibitor of cysteine peptidase
MIYIEYSHIIRTGYQNLRFCMNQILIDENDSDKTFVARLDDIIMITLKENATTGYRWKVDGIDEKIILLENSQYSMHANSSVGSGGTRTFTFRPRSTGSVKVHLSLKREWEKGIHPIRQFVVFIQIS